MDDTSTLYGNENLIISSITYTDKLDATAQTNGKTGTINYNYIGTLKEAKAAAPALGSKSEFFGPKTDKTNNIVLFTRQFTYDGNAAVTVVLTYNQPADETTSVSINTDKKYTLNTKKKSESILKDPAYKDVSEIDRAVAKAILNGTKPWDKVNLQQDGNGGWEVAKNGKAYFKDLVAKTKCEELIAKCQKGMTTFKFSSYTWTVTEKTTGKLSASAKINSKATPPGNPPSAPSGFHWECTGVTSEKASGSDTWTTTTTYETAIDD